MIEFLKNNIIEILLILGLLLIVVATGFVNLVAAIYVLGAFLVLSAFGLIRFTKTDDDWRRWIDEIIWTRNKKPTEAKK